MKSKLSCLTRRPAQAVAVRLPLVTQLSFLSCLLLAVALAACASRSSDPLSEAVIHPSELVPFEELFVFEDTLVLDPSVILGRIWFIDADASGSVLVTDIASDLAHLFTPAGQHEATYNMESCLPSDFGHNLWTSRIADGDRVVLTTLDGTVVVFHRSGNCLAAKRTGSTIRSFCTKGDSMYTFRGPRGMSRSIMDVYSMDLESATEIFLDHPEFYRLNQSYTGVVGRDLDCFDDGPWYKYHEDMDARPVYRGSGMIRARPEFFVKRDQDIPAGLDYREREPVRRAFPVMQGLYAMDDDIRMGEFSFIGEEFRTENSTRRDLWGLSFVSSSSNFISMSTIPYQPPETARHGYLYFLGDNVPMENGDVGNPAILKYKFNPPDFSD